LATRRCNAVIAVAAFLGHGEQPRADKLAEVPARGRPGNVRQRGQLAAGQGLPAHKGGEHGRARGVADQRRHLDHGCRRDHGRIYRGPRAASKQ